MKGDFYMGFITWIIVGAISGWLDSIIMGKNKEMGAIANIIVGIVGAFIGGFVLGLFGINGVEGGNLIWSILVSLIGSVILLWIVNIFKK